MPITTTVVIISWGTYCIPAMVLSILHIVANFPHSEQVGREHQSPHCTDEGSKKMISHKARKWFCELGFVPRLSASFLFAVMLIGNLSGL